MGNSITYNTAKTYRITGPAVWGIGASMRSGDLATGDVVTLLSGRVDSDGDVVTTGGDYIRASSLTPEDDVAQEPTEPEPAVPPRLAAAAQAAQVLSLVRGSLSSIPASEVVALATFLLGEEASA